MKVIVAVKRVIDFNIKIRIKSDQSAVETANLKTIMNPFDEIAVEEAVRLKEKNLAAEIVAVTMGADHSQEVLRTALAMGADRAILLKTQQELQPLAIAKLLQQVIDKEKPNLVILGKQAIDDDCNQTGQMLAGLLNWPQGTFISELHVENQKVKVTREVDEGLETLLLKLPAVVTTDLRLNQPRYISLPNIMKAKQKPLETIAADELAKDLKNNWLIKKVTPPKTRKTGVMVKTVQELINKLKNEAKVF